MDSLKKALLINIVMVSMVIIVIAVFYHLSEQRSLNQSVDEQLSKIESLISTQIKSRAVSAISKADMIASQPWVQKAMSEGDREYLKQMLVPMFTQLRDQYGATQSQFHTVDSHSFLRLHKPDKFGDDLSAFRKTVALTNYNKLPHSGPEIGRAGLGIRGVVPIFHDGKHVGSFEIGFDFTSLIENINRLTNAEIAVLVSNRKISALQVLDREVKNVYHQIGDYSELVSTHWNEIQHALSPASLQKVNEIKTDFNVAKRSHAVLMMPLHDFSGESIGVISAVVDISSLATHSKRSFYAVIGVAIIASITMIGCIIISFNSTLVKPLQELSSHIEDMGEKEELSPLHIEFTLDVLNNLQQLINKCIAKHNAGNK